MRDGVTVGPESRRPGPRWAHKRARQGELSSMEGAQVVQRTLGLQDGVLDGMS